MAQEGQYLTSVKPCIQTLENNNKKIVRNIKMHLKVGNHDYRIKIIPHPEGSVKRPSMDIYDGGFLKSRLLSSKRGCILC
jgi:hypothetical protein